MAGDAIISEAQKSQDIGKSLDQLMSALPSDKRSKLKPVFDTFKKTLQDMGGFGALASMTSGVADIMKDSYKAIDEVTQGLKSDLGDFMGEYEKIRTTYGDLQSLIQNNETAAGAALRRYENILDVTYKSHVRFGNTLVKTDDVLMKAIGSTERYHNANFRAGEAAEYVEDIQKRLTEQYAQQINHMDVASTIKLPLYVKGMMLGTEQISEMVRLQLARTGQANTDLLDEVAAFTRDISRATGVSVASLNQDVVKIMTNTRAFGDITAEEAVRIIGNLNQIGLKYDDLDRTQQKFNKFSDAASNVGKISQLTGVQLDAQRLSYLSATGQVDKALLYMKKQFREQGFTKDDFMSLELPMRQAIQDALPFEKQQDLMTFLDGSRKIQDLTKVTAKTRAEMAKDEHFGIKNVTDNLDKMAGAFKTQEDRIMEFRVNAMEPLAKEGHATAQAFRALNLELIGANIPGQKEMGDFHLNYLRKMRDLALDPSTKQFLGKVGVNFEGANQNTPVSGQNSYAAKGIDLLGTLGSAGLTSAEYTLGAATRLLPGTGNYISNARGLIGGMFTPQQFSTLAIPDQAALNYQKQTMSSTSTGTGAPDYLATASRVLTQQEAQHAASAANAKMLNTTMEALIKKQEIDGENLVKEMQAGQTLVINVPVQGGGMYQYKVQKSNTGLTLLDSVQLK